MIEASCFISHCYNIANVSDVSEACYLIWTGNMSNTNIQHAPKAESLPPDGFDQHLLWAHLQAMEWKEALIIRTHAAENSLAHVWMANKTSLLPLMLPSDIDPSPIEVLDMVRCGWLSGGPCSTGRCRQSCDSSDVVFDVRQVWRERRMR